MWKQAVLLLALLAVANATTLASWNQTILPLPHGGSFATAASGEKDPSVISYYIATNNFTIDEDGDTKPDLKVTARVFLGNHTYAEPTVEWTPESTKGDWTNVKTYRIIDPCLGIQRPSTVAFLLIDPQNITLVSDVLVASNPLVSLVNGVPTEGDSSRCLDDVMRGMPQAPRQCSQYFKFDFSAIPDSLNGFSLNLTVKSTSGNPMPFTRAYLASGASCPTEVKDQHWYSINFTPNTPGVTPTLVTFPGIANGTHHRSWWVMLDVNPEDETTARTPYAVTLTYTTNAVPVPISPNSPSKEPANKPTPPPQRPSKPVPTWAVVIICVACILLAGGALFWAWRLTKKKESSNSYEIY